MPDPKRKVTQKDVARAAGVDPSTVSLALRNHPSIREETRRRIRAVVAKLGYAPDPMMSALSAYRTRARPAHFHGTLAWVVNWDGWRDMPHFRDYFTGAQEQARELGYQLEVFPLHAEGMTPKRAAGILRARGINGLIICPLAASETELCLPWEYFSVVALGYTLKTPQLHMIASAHFHAGSVVLDRLLAAGRRRIGFCLSDIHDTRVGHNYVATYYTALGLQKIPVLPFHDEWRPIDEMRAWIDRHQIDGIVTGWYGHEGYERLRALKLKMPSQLAVACPAVARSDGPISGIYEDSILIGRTATNFLIGMLYRGERGVPATRQRVLVEGRWCQGKTMPA